MRGSPHSLGSDLLQLLSHVVAYWLIALVTLAWSRVDVPWGVAAVGWVADVSGLVGVFLLCATHDVRLFGELLMELRRILRRFRRPRR
jgi:hypothetical protein